MSRYKTTNLAKALCLLIFSMFLFSFAAHSQNTITGKVIDSSGTPLIGATVTLKRTKNSTTTNEQGIFSLSNVPASGILIISYVGYANNEIKYTAGKAISISLEETTAEGEEIIVTGVFDKRKKIRIIGCNFYIKCKTNFTACAHKCC